MRAVQRSALVAVVMIGVLMGSQAAMALTWYSRSDPLRVKEDGVTQGAAYGNFFNHNGVYARSASTRRDVRPGGDGVFVETNFSFYYIYGDQPAAFRSVGTKQTSRTSSGTWVATYHQRALRDDADRARASIKICEDQSWSSDPCSPRVLRTFSY